MSKEIQKQIDMQRDEILDLLQSPIKQHLIHEPIDDPDNLLDRIMATFAHYDVEIDDYTKGRIEGDLRAIITDEMRNTSKEAFDAIDADIDIMGFTAGMDELEELIREDAREKDE